jgi:hypothetical protein
MRNARMLKRLLSLAGLVILAAACASPAASTAPSGTATFTSATSPSAIPSTTNVDLLALLAGKYGTTIPADAGAPPGQWGLAIENGGLVFTHPEGRTFSPGTVEEVTATEIVLGPDPACPDQQTATAGRYRWNLDGDTLTFEEVSDSCRDRASTLTAEAWTLTP